MQVDESLAQGRRILGNATKFFIDKSSSVVKQYGLMKEPLVIEKDMPYYL